MDSPDLQPQLPDREAALLAEALTRPPNKRSDFLDGACHGDPELRARLGALIPDLEDATVLAGAEGTLMVPRPDEAEGSLIGRYRLVEKLGEGGFGVVWLAEQKEPVRRKVALKIIKLGMDTKAVVARFEAERQALAMMDHPNIAKVLDAGTTEAGRPYFVMELVRGVRITDYCDQGNLSTLERLALFIKVCHAIQHAHQKGIIHRDIKPSNVMVTLHDGVPVPKVIDFGIAKATQGDLTDQAVHTQFHQFLGTPAYMSPEQAEMSGLDIDTRSDIYSLGVVLYELLVGSTPFDANELMASGIDALRRTIREKEPVPPSTRVATLRGDRQAATARSRSADGTRLMQQLRGDLDWIVMKCLEKDRQRRYETANALAADLQRHLNNEPVVARPPTAGYRFRKLVRRNRTLFVAGSVVAVALLGLMVSIVVFSVLFARQQQRTSTALRANLAAEYLRRGQNLCLAGKVTEGLHWFGRSLQQVPADQTNLITTIRYNLGSWSVARNRPLAVIRQDALIYAAAFSPTEDRVALGGNETTAQMYSATTGEPFGRVMPNQDPSINQIKFSPDGKLLATVAGKALLWSASDGRPVFPQFGPTNYVDSVEFSPDSRRLVVGTRGSFARQWSVESGEPIGPPMVHAGDVWHVAFSPDGRWIGTGSADRTARIWSAESGSPECPPLVHEGAVRSVAFSPDGRVLATLGADRTVRLWAVPGGQPLAPPILHDDEVLTMAFSPDSQRLVTGGGGGLARIWNLKGEPMGSPMGNEAGVLVAVFTPDGRRVVTGGRDRAARFWSAASGEPLGQPLEHDGWVSEIHFSRDGSKMLTRTYGHTAFVWSATVESAPEIEIREQPLLAGVFSPDGSRILTANILGEVRLWSAETGEPAGIAVKHDRTWNVDFSPDGKVFLTAGSDTRVRFWTTASGDSWGEPLVHPAKGIRAARFSPDGSLVATACFDGTARVWSMATRQQVGAPLSQGKVMEDVAFSPDGRRLVTASSDGRARVWSLDTQRDEFPPLEHRSAVLGAVFSPDGRWILTGSRDATARLWDAATGKPAGPPMPHSDWVEEVDFSPDGTLIVTGTGDGRAWLWSAADGQLLGPPLRTDGPIMDVRFSPDGKNIMASSQARRFWQPQGPTFHGGKIWRIPEPFTGPISTVESWIEAQTGRSLDERGVLSWLDGKTWRQRLREFGKDGRMDSP